MASTISPLHHSHEAAEPFAELCAKSNFSLLWGGAHPEQMVESARELGIFALAVADRNGFYGSVRTHVAGKKQGVPTIVGAELPLSIGRLRGDKAPLAVPLVLLVQSRSGYTHLCKLLTSAHADRPREEALLRAPQLAEHAGLTAILPIEVGACRATEAEGPLWDSAVRTLKECFGSDLYFATARHLQEDDSRIERAARKLAQSFDVPLLATARPLFHHNGCKPLVDVLTCIREKTTLDRAGKLLSPNSQAFLHSPSQMARLFRDEPQRVRQTVEVAESCCFSLDELQYSFPCEELLAGESSNQALRRLVERFLPERYPRGAPSSVQQQIEKELHLIGKLDVAPFFLSVFEVVQIARSKKILCQGRGSAANSAVCFVLGITAVDPARSNLLFERFLSAERNEPPDIDVDFEHERREEVIQAIYEKYGRDRAAMVSEVTCYRARSALRETAKAFGLASDQVDRLAKTVGHYDPVEWKPERLREMGFDPHDSRMKMLLAVAQQLQGFPRHMSTHVGGFVLSSSPLYEIAPVEPAKMPGRTVLQWDKDDIDALGFFKVDVLGLGMLTALRKALQLVARSSGESNVDPVSLLANIPPEDSRVYDAICRADTIGVFQIESRAQMAMLPRLRPRRFYDLVIEVAIVRPGPIQGGMVHPYLRRRRGDEPVDMPHPSLESILRRTLGVPLFQEQVMQLAIVGGGYTGGEADELRRDMAAWRKDGRLLRHKEKLLRGFLARGIPEEFAERLFSQIKGFGEYGFPESHAASFALLVYASAWVKTHHPAEFACALLNSQPMGFYSPSSIVRDAQTHGVNVMPPDVSASEWDCTLEPISSEPEPNDTTKNAVHRPTGPAYALRLGLRLIKGIGEGAARPIVAARNISSFRDVQDLAERAGLPASAVHTLAEAGALASLVPHRREAMWKSRAPRFGELFKGVVHREPEARLPLLSKVQQLQLDYERVGLSVSDHPFCHLRGSLERRKVVPCADLPKLRHGTSLRVAGLVLTRQRPMTASGVVFVTIEDETGTANLVLMPDTFETFRTIASSASMLLVDGKVERSPPDPDPEGAESPVIHVRVHRLETLRLLGGLASRSRDFH